MVRPIVPALARPATAGRGRVRRGVGRPFARWTMGLQINRRRDHRPLRVADASIAGLATVPLATFGEARDAGLKELIRRQAKEGGDFINVLELQFVPLSIEKPGHPRAGFL